MKKVSAHRQHGATALEFALIFPLLFSLLYGVVVYAYLFVLQESMTYAAQQGAAAVVRINPTITGGEGFQAEAESRARRRVEESLDWLPNRATLLGAGSENVQVQPVADVAGTVVEVRLNIPIEPIRDIFPSVSLPLVGEIPPLPPALSASASILVGEPAP